MSIEEIILHIEILKRIYVYTLDDDGNITAPIKEVMDAWNFLNELKTKKKTKWKH